MFAVVLSAMTGTPIYNPATVIAAEDVMPQEALEMFFQLGLPDTRGAKWVRAFGRSIPYRPAFPNGNYTGNAWLVREEKDGTVELVVGQGQRLRGWRFDPRNPQSGNNSTLPQFQIQPADLDRDLKTLASALQANNENSGDSNTESDYRRAQRQQGYGGALLMLAHLQRQERSEAVRTLLPKLLAQEKFPEPILDSAVSLLADSHLAQCTQEWTKVGDAAAFANALEKLTAEFPRGWSNRDAVLLLIGKVRGQKPLPTDTLPEVKKVAELFLKLTPEQNRMLPRGKNWLLDSEATSGPNMEALLQEDEYVVVEDSSSPASNAGTPSSGNPLASFFKQKMKAVEILAHLIEDERLLRVPRTQGYTSWTYYSPSSISRDEIIRRSYRQIARPYELGEVVWELLQQLVPEQIRSQVEKSSAGNSVRVLAWVEKNRNITEEQLAWSYLRESNGADDNDFRSSISYLVEKGSQETQTKLQEVFLDPAVWSNGSIDPLAPVLEKYLKRMTSEGDVTAFGEKLRAIVTKAVELQNEEFSSASVQIDEETRNRIAAQRAAELKKLAQLLKPRRFADLAAELAAASTTEESQAALEVIETAAQTAPLAEVEPALYQAAAKAKETATKRRILELIQRAFYRSARGGIPQQISAPAASIDPVTSEALRQLLEDESIPRAEVTFNNTEQTIADFAASVLTWPRIKPEEQREWMGLWQTSPYIAATALRTHARALAAGQPTPARPNPANVPADEVRKIIQELSALPASQIAGALHGKSIDQQLAVAQHLAALSEWPDVLREAHFTIAAVRASDDQPGIFKADTWRGRPLDDTTRKEIQTAVTLAALEGNPLFVNVSASGPLSGLTLSVQRNTQEIPPEAIAESVPGLEGKPTPIAVIYYLIQTVGESGQPAGYSVPIWKDEALNEAWVKEHLQRSVGPNTSTDTKEEDPDNGQFNPQLFEKHWQETLALKSSAKSTFSLHWQAATLRQADDEEGEN